jgi:hypothetical protein
MVYCVLSPQPPPALLVLSQFCWGVISTLVVSLANYYYIDRYRRHEWKDLSSLVCEGLLRKTAWDNVTHLSETSSQRITNNVEQSS